MGRNLSNLFISESFQYLTQVSGSELQTGLGTTITGSLLITASKADTATSASYTVSSSYSNTSTSASYALVSTSSSFATNATNASTASIATSASYALTASFALNAGTTVSTASLLTTASAVANVITFTKGDGSTFPVTVATGSAVSASFATTASLALNNVLTASSTNATITFTKGDATTFPLTINNVVNANSASVATSASYAVSSSQAQTAVSSSFATSASYAVSASQAQNAVTASFALNVTPLNTGSFITTASISNATTTFTKGDGSTFALVTNNVVNANSASVATSASFATTASFAQTIASGLSPTFANVTASNVLITGTASVALLYTTTISSSVIYSSGSNQFGDASNDVQTLWGTVDVKTGPVLVTGSVTSTTGFTGSLQGTASFATSASQAVTASYVASVVSASFATSASQATSASFAISSSRAVSASFATNALSASYAPASSPFPYTGSAQITGSLGITGSMILGIQQNDITNPNGIIAGNNNLINGPSNVSFVFAGNSVMNQYCDYGGIFGGIGHRVQYGYSHVFGGNYNYVGYNSPGPSSDVYAAGIFGGANNTVNGYRSNNQTILGGSGNQIYTYNAAADFEPNPTIVGGTNNYISGSFSFDNTIIGGRGNFIGSNVSRSAVIGGTAITASESSTVYVPNLRVSGTLIEQGSSTSGAPGMILASGSGRPLYFYAGGGINPTFDVESNQAIQHFIAGGAQCYTSLGLSNSWFFGYNYGATPTVVMNANNFTEVNFGLHVSGGLEVTGSNIIKGTTTITGSILGNVLGNNTDTYTSSAAVQQVVTLTQTEYNAIGSPNANTLYIISGSNPTSYATTGSNTFYGTQTFSGSVRGVVISGSTSSNTASLDFSTGNFFRLNTNNITNTYILPTNLQAGQTVNLELTYPATASVITFPSFVKQPSGSAYTPSGAGTTDILTFIAFTTGSLYLSSVKNFI